MTDPSFAPLDDDGDDDLPRTFRREKEARAREARERAAQERAAAPSLSSDPDPRYANPAPQIDPRDDTQPLIEDMPYPASIHRLEVPMLQLSWFLIKAVVAGIPALILLTAILWLFGEALQSLFPELVKMRIIFSFPD